MKKSAAQLKAVTKPDTSAIKADLEMQLTAARTAQADKLAQSEAHLVGQLTVAAEKYLTVNGYMQARGTLEQAKFGHDVAATELDDLALQVARGMSDLALELADNLSRVDVMAVDESFLDGLLDKDFVNGQPTMVKLVRQLLVVNLLQNIGPSIDDIVEFRTSTNRAIATLEDELAKHV